MKNFLRITFVLLLLAVTGSTATRGQNSTPAGPIGGFGGPYPNCDPNGVCTPN
jgi:hypothetical protein